MSRIDVEVARRVARLMAEQEALLGIRLEVATVELPANGGDLVVRFRPWEQPRGQEGDSR